MNMSSKGAHILIVLGFLCMLIGAIPLEGSIIILPGAEMVALGAFLGRSRHQKLIYWSFGLLAFGVAAT